MMLVAAATVTSAVAQSPYTDSTETTIDAGAVCFNPDYFFIDGSCCPQSPREGAPCCRSLAYNRVGPCGAEQRISEQEFFGSFDPNLPICIFVHGSFAPQEAHKYEEPHIYPWIQNAVPETRLQVVYYRWPSGLPLFPCTKLTSAVLGRRAGYHGFYLAGVLSRLPAGSRVCLFGHSHGVRISMSALHLLGGGCVQGYEFKRQPCREQSQPRIRLLAAAAAFDHHWLNPGERYDRALYATEGVLNFRTPKDWVLRLYPCRKPCGRRAFGTMGLLADDREKLGALAFRIRQYDVERTVGRGHTIHHYYERPQLAGIAAPVIYSLD